MNRKAKKWPSDYRFRRITELLGPSFLPTRSAEIAKKMRRSSSLVESYLRSMSYNRGFFIYHMVYRLGPHLWAISQKGQEALGLEETAEDDCIGWLSVYLDAFVEGGERREEALEAFKWFNWLALRGKPIVFMAALELARHPWVNSGSPRWKAIGVFGDIARELSTPYEAAQVLDAVKLGADTDQKFSKWIRRTGTIGEGLAGLQGKEDA